MTVVVLAFCFGIGYRANHIVSCDRCYMTQRNRNSNRGKVGNTETSSAVKSFSIYNLIWCLISYQLLRHYQENFQNGKRLTWKKNVKLLPLFLAVPGPACKSSDWVHNLTLTLTIDGHKMHFKFNLEAFSCLYFIIVFKNSLIMGGGSDFNLSFEF